LHIQDLPLSLSLELGPENPEQTFSKQYQKAFRAAFVKSKSAKFINTPKDWKDMCQEAQSAHLDQSLVYPFVKGRFQPMLSSQYMCLFL